MFASYLLCSQNVFCTYEVKSRRNGEEKGAGGKLEGVLSAVSDYITKSQLRGICLPFVSFFVNK